MMSRLMSGTISGTSFVSESIPLADVLPPWHLLVSCLSGITLDLILICVAFNTSTGVDCRDLSLLALCMLTTHTLLAIKESVSYCYILHQK